ncbi:MAG: hypothetical protein R3E58_11215 [Phycisphaerae bacterium]
MLDSQAHAAAKQQLSHFVQATAANFSIQADLRFIEDYPVLINDADCAALVAEVATETLGAENVVTQANPGMGAKTSRSTPNTCRLRCTAWDCDPRERWSIPTCTTRTSTSTTTQSPRRDHAKHDRPSLSAEARQLVNRSSNKRSATAL